MAIYKDTHDSLMLEELHLYGSQRLGIIKENRLLAKYVNIFPPSSPLKINTPNSSYIPAIPKSIGGSITPITPIPLPYNFVHYYFGKKHYELTDWLGNVRVVVNDKKTPINSGTTTVSYRPQIMSVSDYYSFGSEIAERSYDFSLQYRFGFQRQEKDNEIYGKGNAYYFKFREQDARIGRFWSVDPLAGKYPHNSPYAFAENRVIDGVELEGKEYLNANESRIEIIAGEVKMKVSNFLYLNRRAYENANNNPNNWSSGEVGISTTIGKIKFNSVVDNINSFPSFMSENLAKGDVNADYPTRAPAVSPTNDDANPVVSAPGGSRGAAGIVGIVDIINFGLEQYAVWTAWYDMMKIEEHKSILQKKVTSDVYKAIKRGMIPKKYQNSTDIGSIMNVVLQGVNNSGNKEIYKIGMKIWNTISNPPPKDNPAKGYKKEVAPADKTQVSRPRFN